MKVLQLCLRVPDPPADGGAIAMKSIAESLMSAGVKVKILAFNTRKHFVEPSSLNTGFAVSTSMETVYLDATVRIIPAFLNLFSASSININRFKSGEFEKKLEEILKTEHFDVVQLESLYLAYYVETIRKHSKAKVVLRAHNIEYLIWERMAGAAKGFFKKKYLALLTRKLKRFELSMLNRYDAILPITGEDSKVLLRLGCRIKIFVVPLGLHTGLYPISAKGRQNFSLFHLGSMDWMPNLEAIHWFLKEIWPLVKENEPGIRLFLAGKNMPESIRQAADGDKLVVDDFISDARKYMSDKTVMVVPLLSGSGMRVKIMEGMAMGKTIISTSIGAEGTGCTHLQNILIADHPEEFVKWIHRCKNDPEFCTKIGLQARAYVDAHFDQAVIGQNLLNFYLNDVADPLNLQPDN